MRTKTSGPPERPSNGPDGVCGPCSEIFFHPPNGSKEVEIWNLVFTQFNRVGDPPDNLRPLPKKNIDTGMGLERTASVLQGVESNFEIDILKPLCLAAAAAVGIEYDFYNPHGRPIRRIADHMRAVTFAIHEGVQPGSEKESYVVRQLLRRALLEGYLLGKHEPFVFEIVPAVVNAMRAAYPELAKTAENVADVIRDEENQFLSVVEKGLHKFQQSVATAQKEGRSTITGDEAFDLHQTDGFLVELTEAMAAHMNLAVDRKRYNALMEQHKKGSGSGAFLDAVMAEGPLDALRKTSGGTEFLGYESTEAEAEVVGIIAEKQLVDTMTEIGHATPIGVVLDRTPFYGEAGGQVGDTGRADRRNLRVRGGRHAAQRLADFAHRPPQTRQARSRRESHCPRRYIAPCAGIRRAHSATHLLHHALRQTVGEQATQRGSKVEDDALRFDFTHRGPLTPDEIRRVEDEINARVAEGAAVSTPK